MSDSQISPDDLDDLGIIKRVNVEQPAASEHNDECSDCECSDCIGCVG